MGVAPFENRPVAEPAARSAATPAAIMDTLQSAGIALGA